MLIQLNEVDCLTGKVLSKTKCRTEIQENSQNPSFDINYFIFENFKFNTHEQGFNNIAKKIYNSENEITYFVRFGLFSSFIYNNGRNGIKPKPRIKENKKEENKWLIENSKLIANANLNLNHSLLENIINHEYIDLSLSLYSIDKTDYEISKISIRIKLNIKEKSLLEKINVDNIKKLIYDPFENDNSIVKKVSPLLDQSVAKI